MDYFAHPAISNSKLGWFKKSPAHFKYFQDNRVQDSEAFLFGGASHCILFEPEKFTKEFYVIDESKRPEPGSSFGNRKNKEWKSEIYQAYSHKKIITKETHEEISVMMEAMQKHSFVQELIKDCKFEQEVFWIDPVTKLECKKKVDGECSTHRIDYKTTDDADPIPWQKKAWKYDYYRQAGFYDLSEPKEFYFIVQEKKPPYGISIHRATNDVMDFGKNEAMLLLRNIESCIKYNQWPGYESDIFKPGATERELNYFDFDLPMWVRQTM
jgi:hypothetical protein